MDSHEYLLGLHQPQETERHLMEPHNRDVFDALADSIDETPRFVAGLAFGALVMLVALKQLRFRFVFGAGAGR